MDSIKKIKNQNLMASAGNLIIGPWLDLPSANDSKQKSVTEHKMTHLP